MTIAIATVAHSFATLGVTGLVMKDIHEIPATAGDRSPMLIPAPDYLTNFEMVRDSYGDGVAKMTVTYTINYVLCYTPAGAGRSSVLEYYDEMIAMCTLIIDKVLAINQFGGAVDIMPDGITGMGIVQDPAANDYIGCFMGFRVTEFVN